MANIPSNSLESSSFVYRPSEGSSGKVMPALAGVSSKVSSVWQRGSLDIVRRSRQFETGSRDSTKLIGLQREIELQDLAGRTIEGEYMNPSGDVLAKETASRIPGQRALSITLEQSFRQLHKQELAYMKELSLLSKDQAKTAEIQAKLEDIRKKIAANREMYRNLETDDVVDRRKFFDSNYHRAFMKEGLQKLRGMNLDGTLYKILADKVNPGLVNARNIQLTLGKGSESYGLLRLGVMSDLRNGTTNLRELKKIVEGGAALKDEAVRKLQQEKARYKPHTPAFASLEMAIKELENPEKALFSRRERMNVLMLQYLTASAQRDLSKLTANTWKVIDVRLLDTAKHSIDKGCGWVHDETNELLDMAEIFREFNGKTVVFGTDGPHIDGDKVYIPLPGLKPGATREVTLSATLLNISIQSPSQKGGPKNEGVQAEINRDALHNLQKLQDSSLFDDEEWKTMCALLAKGVSNATVAEQAVCALLRRGDYSVSVGCLSAKDRTGWVVGRALIKLVAGVDKSLRRFLTRQLVSAASVSSQILKDVTGWNFMKLDFRTMGDEASASIKLRHVAGLTAEWAVEGIKKKVKKIASTEIVDPIKRKFVPIFLNVA